MCTFIWQRTQLYFNVYRQETFSLESSSPKQCLENAKALEKYLKYSEKDIEYWQTQAKEATKRDKMDWNDSINSERKWGYEEDMKKNATYASIICLVLCILGRYLTLSSQNG